MGSMKKRNKMKSMVINSKKFKNNKIQSDVSLSNNLSIEELEKMSYENWEKYTMKKIFDSMTEVK
jgi:hypothetical protein